MDYNFHCGWRINVFKIMIKNDIVMVTGKKKQGHFTKLLKIVTDCNCLFFFSFSVDKSHLFTINKIII